MIMGKDLQEGAHPSKDVDPSGVLSLYTGPSRRLPDISVLTFRHTRAPRG